MQIPPTYDETGQDRDQFAMIDVDLFPSSFFHGVVPCHDKDQ